ncbi:MAG: hypothetical protein AAGD23_12755 [Pseudomonadota bacterium]
MEAVVWRKLGVFRRWPAFFSALVYALAAVILLMIATTLADAAPEPRGLSQAGHAPIQASVGMATQHSSSIGSVPCTCRMEKRDYSLGDQVCIRGQRAVCDRVLNNTSWRFLGQSCPLS